MRELAPFASRRSHILSPPPKGRRFVSPQPAGSLGPRQGAGDLGWGL